jgi:hypothetical protein
MATIIKEKFDGLRENFDAEKREYFCTYICKGIAYGNQFSPYFRWDCKGRVDIFARMVGVVASHQLNADWFEVEVHYSTKPDDLTQKSKDKDQPENPLARPVRRRWWIGYTEMFPPADLNKKPFTVCTGEPIQGGVPVKIPYLVKNYIRNEAIFPESTALEMCWAMDSSKKILCAKFDGSEELVDLTTGIKFVEVTYEFWCLGDWKLYGTEPFTWEDKRIEAGSYWLQVDSKDRKLKPKYLEDAVGTKSYANGAILLNPITQGKLSQDEINEGHFYWINFQTHRIVDFSSLNLPGI